MVRMNPDQSGSGCSLSLYSAGGVVWRNTESVTGYNIFPLSAGSYKLVVQAEGFTDFLKEIRIEPGLMNGIDVSMTALIHPTLETVFTKMHMELNEGENKIQAIGISNSGDLTLTGSANVSSSWLSVLNKDFILSGDASSVLQIRFDTGKLQSGTYTSILTLTSNDPEKPSISIPVTLTVFDPVSAEPIMQLVDLSLTIQIQEQPASNILSSSGIQVTQISNIV